MLNLLNPIEHDKTMQITIDETNESICQKIRAVLHAGAARTPEEAVVYLLLQSPVLVAVQTTQIPEPSYTALEAFDRLGLIGCVAGGPTDLSTNPAHMAGFGSWC